MKIHHLKTYFPLKVRIFQGHVSFQRCSPNGKTPRKQASMHYSSPQNRPNVSQSLDCVFGGFRMSNKNCTSYFLDANRKNITKKKRTTKGGPTTGWFCFFYSGWVQVPKFRWLEILVTYFVQFSFVGIGGCSPKLPPKETPKFSSLGIWPLKDNDAPATRAERIVRFRNLDENGGMFC